MKKLSYSLVLVFLLGCISSCRPSYMRCPKNRRCVEVIPQEIKKDIPLTIIKTTSKEKNS